MRIIGGLYKGRVFNPGKNFRAHPTTDVAKEGLFNILANRYNFEKLYILDLFSGTGSISYEFASRGCTHVTLVESDPVHFRYITETIRKLQTNAITPLKADVFNFLRKSQQKYDLIFADPPYELRELKNLPELILVAGILNPDSRIILEHPKEFNFAGHPAFKELRQYGKVHFSFFGK